jgi:hypothetical protein
MTTTSFKKNRYAIAALFLAAIPAALFLFSCKKEKDTNSPAHHINESEKLAIPAAIELPANLPGGNARVATFYAVGVQKYKSQPKAGSSPITYEWIFVAPDAKLYDITNVKIGTHSAGPTWQLSALDSIYAQQFSPAKSSPSPDPTSIDWLQLMPKAGKTPTGVFASVSYIQRIATKGGKAPAVLPLSAAETIDVPYTAIYRFTKKNP